MNRLLAIIFAATFGVFACTENLSTLSNLQFNESNPSIENASSPSSEKDNDSITTIEKTSLTSQPVPNTDTISTPPVSKVDIIETVSNTPAPKPHTESSPTIEQPAQQESSFLSWIPHPISGVVYDGYGQVLEGVTIKIEALTSDEQKVKSVTTNTSGQYHFEETPYQFKLIASKDGHYTKTIEGAHRSCCGETRWIEDKPVSFKANLFDFGRNPEGDFYPETALFQDDRSTISGLIFDDENQPVPEAQVTGRSLNERVPFEKSVVTDNDGAYTLTGVPSSVQLEISVKKLGYTKRRRIEVIKSSKCGDPDLTAFHFGKTTASCYAASAELTAISTKPEVIMASPDRNESNVKKDTDFVLVFSESMDTLSVEKAFEIHSMNNKELKWGKDAFDIVWTLDDTKVTFTFKNSIALLGDESNKYQITFTSDLKDKSGNARKNGFFKLTDIESEENILFETIKD